MARFPRQGRGVYRWSKRRGSVGTATLASREPRGLQIGRTGSGSDPTLGSRTYEATQAPWLPSGRTPSRGCGGAGSLGRRRRSGPGLQTRSTRATTTEGARAHASRRGARNPSGSHAAKSGHASRTPCPSLGGDSAHAARIRKEPSSFPPPRRASSNVPSSPRKRRRPREGDAERVDRRHGSSASSHGPHGSCSLPSKRRGHNSPRFQKDPRAGERGDALLETIVRASGRNRARGSSSGGQPSPGRTRTEAASLARRRIHGSRACPRVEHVLQRSVAQSWPTEAVGSQRRSRDAGDPAGGGG